MAQEIIILKCHNPRCGLWIAPLGEEHPCVCGAHVFELDADGDGRLKAISQYTLDVDMAVSCAASYDLAPHIMARESRRQPGVSSNVVPLLLCGSCLDWKVDDARKECSCGEIVNAPPAQGDKQASGALVVKYEGDSFLLDVNALMGVLDGAAGSQFREFVVRDYLSRAA